MRVVQETLTGEGLKWFSVSCLLTSLNSMAAPTVYWLRQRNSDEQWFLQKVYPEDVRTYMSAYLAGFVCLGSLVAYENLAKLQQVHNQTLSQGKFHDFNVNWKFFWAKIMASFVTVMCIFFKLAMFLEAHAWCTWYTDMQQNLLKAAMLNTVCLGAAVYAHTVWTPESAWYRGNSSGRCLVSSLGHDIFSPCHLDDEEGSPEALEEPERLQEPLLPHGTTRLDDV